MSKISCGMWFYFSFLLCASICAFLDDQDCSKPPSTIPLQEPTEFEFFSGEEEWPTAKPKQSISQYDYDRAPRYSVTPSVWHQLFSQHHMAMSLTLMWPHHGAKNFPKFKAPIHRVVRMLKVFYESRIGVQEYKITTTTGSANTSSNKTACSILLYSWFQNQRSRL
jgi:hypothetical protein